MLSGGISSEIRSVFALLCFCMCVESVADTWVYWIKIHSLFKGQGSGHVHTACLADQYLRHTSCLTLAFCHHKSQSAPPPQPQLNQLLPPPHSSFSSPPYLLKSFKEVIESRGSSLLDPNTFNVARDCGLMGNALISEPLSCLRWDVLSQGRQAEYRIGCFVVILVNYSYLIKKNIKIL